MLLPYTIFRREVILTFHKRCILFHIFQYELLFFNKIFNYFHIFVQFTENFFFLRQQLTIQHMIAKLNA